MKMVENSFFKRPFFKRFLISTSIFAGVLWSTSFTEKTYFHKVQASNLLEFRWENDKGYKKLYYWQSSSDRRDRSTYYLVIRERDRKTAFLKLKITIPSYFDANINPKKLSLCRLQLGGFSSKTRCIEEIPATIELKQDKSAIEIFPNKPVSVDGNVALRMKIFNPAEAGMYQFNALSQPPGDIPMSAYIGSWNIDIE